MTMRIDVAPKAKFALVELMRTVGRAAIAARNKAPGNVSRARMRSRNSAVGRPGLTPGMKPPYLRRLSAWSTGCAAPHNAFGVLDGDAPLALLHEHHRRNDAQGDERHDHLEDLVGVVPPGAD